jgi:geranylgeranyl diphosphate synthase type I
MPSERTPHQGRRAIEPVRARVDEVLFRILAERRGELDALDPAAADLAEELLRLVGAGGKRLRPAFLYWGHLAAGGEDGEPVIRAAAALELLHTFALVHDDVMDDAAERRGVPTTQVAFAKLAPGTLDPVRFGTGTAVLVGDLALALSGPLLRSARFPPDRLAVALERFDRMCLRMAAGQYLDLRGSSSSSGDAAERVALLKGGSYTVEGPVLIGSALAGAGPELERTLAAFARPAGEAFQLRDDLADRDAAPSVTANTVERLLDEAVAALEDPGLEPAAADALRSLAGLLRASAPGAGAATA